MSDDIKTKDRAGASIDLAAKETAAGKLTPRNLLVDTAGADVDPASQATLALAAASLNTLDDWDESDRAKVNPIAGQAGVAAGAGAVSASTQRMTLANDDPAVAALGVKVTSVTALETGGSGAIGWLSQLWRDTVAGFNRLPATLGIKTAAASLSVAPASDAVFAHSAAASTAAGGVALWARMPSAAATTNPTLTKMAAGRVYSIYGQSAAASTRYLKLYNKASAPTVGTDAPLLTLALPAGAGFAFELANGNGAYFSTGIAWALTAGAADADATALAVGDVVGLNLGYA